jgi:hypothetical protein
VGAASRAPGTHGGGVADVSTFPGVQTGASTGVHVDVCAGAGVGMVGTTGGGEGAGGAAAGGFVLMAGGGGAVAKGD